MTIAMPANATPSSQEPMQASWTPEGRLRVENLPAGDTTYTMLMHMAPVLSIALGPGAPLGAVAVLVMWLVRKDQSAFVDDHGREIINFCLSYVLIFFGLSITIIGFPVAVVYGIVGIVSLIRGAIASSRGEFFRYPMIIRFLN